MVANEQRKPSVATDIVDGARLDFGAMVTDDYGRECLVGLTSIETQEYQLLHKIALHGDDESFLRYIELGDRHESALVSRRKRSTPA